MYCFDKTLIFQLFLLLFRIYETMADDKSISYSPYIHFILFCAEVRHCITSPPEISHAFEMECEYERNNTQSLTRLSGSLCLVLLPHECSTERVEGHLEVASTTNNRKLTPAWCHRGFTAYRMTRSLAWLLSSYFSTCKLLRWDSY
jgi:hypothetical protein